MSNLARSKTLAYMAAFLLALVYFLSFIGLENLIQSDLFRIGYTIIAFGCIWGALYAYRQYRKEMGMISKEESILSERIQIKDKIVWALLRFIPIVVAGSLVFELVELFGFI